MLPPPAALQPGDVLLYGPSGFIGWAIAIKTASLTSHCEIYDGDGHALAARDGVGVGRYPFRRAQLTRALRLNVPFDYDAGKKWFKTVDGNRYDWIGLLGFFWAKRQGAETPEMFCSEFNTRFLRACIWASLGQRVRAFQDKALDKKVLVQLKLDPFRGKDADGVAPTAFDSSPLFDEVDWHE